MRGPTLVHAIGYDLPPSWDGVPVEWDEWSEGRTTIILHAPADALACHQCGSVDEPKISFGSRPPEHPTFMSTRTKTTKKSGRKYTVPHEVEAWAVRDLIASRCRHCLADVVTDLRTDETWDLEDSDYTAEGSTATDVLF